MGANSPVEKWWNSDINSLYPHMMFGQGGPVKNPHPWEKWFAWQPVEINGQRYWFTTVYRRKLRTGYNLYEYGTLFDVLKDE